MESKVNFAAVGAFVIVFTVALIAGVLWLSSGKYYRKSYDTYQVFMAESVAGLNLNAPVRYRGVDVGRVRRITLAPGNVEQVELSLDIERGTPVKEDTLATLQTQGLTGIAYVELTAGHRASPPLVARPGEPYPVIASAPSLMNRLETALPVLLADLTRVSGNLNALLDDENRRALKATLADLAMLSRTLAARSQAIDAALASGARTLDNAARVTAELPQLVARVERTADALDRMAGEVGAAGASGRAALDSAKAAFDGARGTLDGTRDDLRTFTGATLPEVRELVAELRALTATLRRAGDEVERNPSLLLRGRAPGKRGPGE
ncbi:MAG: MCE family protein [Burkholderiales bacterium]|nr:MCE family protein [Burkholderiales bacterium]